MPVELLTHWLLEMCGSGCWACARGKCTKRSHRIMGDMGLTLLVAWITMRMVG